MSIDPSDPFLGLRITPDFVERAEDITQYQLDRLVLRAVSMEVGELVGLSAGLGDIVIGRTNPVFFVVSIVWHPDSGKLGEHRAWLHIGNMKGHDITKTLTTHLVSQLRGGP